MPEHSSIPWTVAALLLVCCGLLAIACTLQRQLIYPRPAAPSAPPTLPENARTLELSSGSEAWLFLPPASAAPAPYPALIFAHGNAELIDYWLGAFDPLGLRGLAVLLVEYPGYGRSEGAPSQQSITATFVAAYDALSARQDIDTQRIVGYGRSLGGGATSALARERKLAALILESTFTSLRALAPRFWFPGSLVADPFDTQAVLAELDAPVLVLHGERDTLIPIAHGEALARTANTDLVRLPCGHNDCPRPWAEILSFLATHRILR